MELTAPYMHDGRFATLEAVIDHYSTEIKAHPRLDNRLRQRGGGGINPLRPNYTVEEKAALVAFLKTLTDPSVATDTRWSDPFNETVCTSTSITLSSAIKDGVYRKVSNEITTSGTVSVGSGKNAILEAANSVTLSAGFHAVAGADLTIKIADCGSTAFLENNENASIARQQVRTEVKSILKGSTASRFNDLKVYPNPFTQALTIDIGGYTNNKVEIYLFNSIGQKIRQVSTQDQVTWDLSQLEKGVYFVRVIENGVLLKTQKVIKI